MISDQHYGPEADERGIALTGKLIALEKPDLVLAVGDCISGDRCFTSADVQKAVGNVGAAMEKAGVPWAIAFGNHDQEHFPATRLDKEAVLKIYESCPHNVNSEWACGIHGGGNKNLVVSNAAGTQPVFALWLIDSGDYSGVKEEGYDWIRTDQVYWYWRTSLAFEEKYGHKVPGLMFFHIPLPEFREMIASKKIIGERHEPESPSAVHSGMFAAVRERGDVLGIFCGHDHVNNYAGRWHGVWLGFDGVVGYRGYPHTPADDVTNGRARGGRVFLLTESDPWSFRTWMRFQDGSTNWEALSDAYERDQLKK